MVPASASLQSHTMPVPPACEPIRTSIAAVEMHCWYFTEFTGGIGSGVGDAVIGVTGAAVTSTGCAVGDPVGASLASGTGAVVGIAVAAATGEDVVGAAVCGTTTGATVGSAVTTGTSVGACCKGAKLQISLPPITLTGVMSAHCRAFCEGYPEFANVLPATTSN